MKDFIFGTLATEDLRTEHVRNRLAGVSHFQRRSPIDPSPGEKVSLELTVGPGQSCQAAWIYWSNDGYDPQGAGGNAIHGVATPMEKAGVEWDTSLWGYIQHFLGSIPAQAAGTVVRYYLSGIEPDGREIIADQDSIYAYYVADDPPPAWSRDAIVYEIFVDRFNPGKGKDWLTPGTPAGFYGGTIRGIYEKLDYLSELGVNTLWLTPIFPSPSHHGYDATDLFDIEPRLGTKNDLRILLDESHRQGFRILLDLVPNHVSDQHPAFQAAITDQRSPYHKWFTFSHWPDQYRSFFDVPELPQLNLREPATRKYVLDAAAHWLDLGVDGYRVDYALGPAPDFWADFRRVTRRARSDCWTFGEVVEPPDTQVAFMGGLDGCLDFNLLEAFRQAFAYGEWNGKAFASFIVRHEAYFPDNFSRPSFLDNHDMNRFLWAAGADLHRLQLAALCQFTLVGPPVIYYGTEVGLSQLRDVRQGEMGLPEESRLPMLWGRAQNTGLLEFYRKLINVRRSYAHFRQGSVHLLQADKHSLVYNQSSDSEVLTALNLSTESQRITLNHRIKEVLVNSSESEPRLINGGITLSPLSGAILIVE